MTISLTGQEFRDFPQNYEKAYVDYSLVKSVAFLFRNQSFFTTKN